MIQMLYDYDTEYTTKHSAACYYIHVDINSTVKTSLRFNLSVVYHVSWSYGYDSGFPNQRL